MVSFAPMILVPECFRPRPLFTVQAPPSISKASSPTPAASPSDEAGSGLASPIKQTKLKKCSICFTEDVSAVYAPCGHAGMVVCVCVFWIDFVRTVPTYNGAYSTTNFGYCDSSVRGKGWLLLVLKRRRRCRAIPSD
jgi:hypothetical protein